MSIHNASGVSRIMSANDIGLQGTVPGTVPSDLTARIREAYNAGDRVYLANNGWGGDPSPGNTKQLFIVWYSGGVGYSGIVSENDGRGIILP